MILGYVVLLLWPAALVVADSCTGRCNHGVNTAYTCQCNTACERYGDCCADYASLCLGATCAGRCNTPLDTNKPCQCDDNCYTYSDCCSDYESLCHGNTGSDSTTLGSVIQDMWNADSNRMTDADISISLSGPKLFTSVNDQKLSTGTYQLFIALLDNYERTIGLTEFMLDYHLQEITAFLDAVMATNVMIIAGSYLTTQGIVSSPVDFRSKVEELWFNLYPRSSSNNVNDSSGFEHVMVGEIKGSSVSGFHNWVQFYHQEQAGNLVYNAMSKQAEPDMKGAQFSWYGASKSVGSFFLGTSPEFDLALYTVCALLHQNARCDFSLEGHPVSIQTWDIAHKPGPQIASAYPAL